VSFFAREMLPAILREGGFFGKRNASRKIGEGIFGFFFFE
jgi:hypothetical protein